MKKRFHLLQFLLLIAFLSFSVTAPSDDHDHESSPKKRGGGKQSDAEPAEEEEVVEENRGCPVNPEGIARFANGQAYQYRNLVTYITTPGCFSDTTVATQALRYGVSFNKKLPLDFESLSQTALSKDFESRQQTEALVREQIPGLLRRYSIGQRELLPLVGQLSLVSPSAARNALSTYVLREISAASPARTGQAEFSADLSKRLVELGAAETSVATEIAGSIEEMALASQASGLLESLKGLASAAANDKVLAATYSMSVAALNRGIDKGKIHYSNDEKNKMTEVVFLSLLAGLPVLPDLPASAADYDDAFKALIQDQSLKRTALRTAWLEVLKVLASPISQPVLANALAKSLTPEVVFLGPTIRNQLFEAAQNYTQLALPIQTKFLQSLRSLREKFGSEKHSGYKEARGKYLDPFFAKTLEFPPEWIQAGWLSATVNANFFTDDAIEKNFPRYVLYQLKRTEKATSNSPLETLSEHFGSLWTLSQVEIPTLHQWVTRNETAEKEE